MSENLLGNAWLRDHYKLPFYHLTHSSFTGTRLRKETNEAGHVKEYYPPHYAPENTPPDHVEFALKYDDLSLNFLKAVFGLTSPEEVAHYIALQPKGAYKRRIGFLYEFLTGRLVAVPDQSKGNYVDLLDEEKYVTGEKVKNQRWLVNDNLLGTREFCPVIRKTPVLQNLLLEDYRKLVEGVTKSFPPGIFHRAVNYLYTKETRSSYQIEQEKPPPERVNRFIRLLERAAEQPTAELLSEKHLTRLQNEIVDLRYGATGFRDFQNYIGQTSYNYRQIIHYVCPPPALVHSLMNGLAGAAMKTKGRNAIARATITAFGFVFIHPFEDGNGRLHRFLIHDMLTREQVVPKGMIIPVSAHMVNHIKEYDTVLENYSKPLLEQVRYEMDDAQAMTVTNPEAVEGYFRYPDLTSQCIYLAETIKGTIVEDIYREMDFLVKYDEVKSSIRDVADMPDKDVDLFIRFVHQNRGRLPERRRKLFDKLTGDEITKMENAFREVFTVPAQEHDDTHP